MWAVSFDGLPWIALAGGFLTTCSNWETTGEPVVRNPPAMQEVWVWFLGWENHLEKEMATHSRILAWRIPWTEEPGRLQSMGSQRVRPNGATKYSTAWTQRRGIYAWGDRWQRVTVASWARGEQDGNDFVRMFSLAIGYNMHWTEEVIVRRTSRASPINPRVKCWTEEMAWGGEPFQRKQLLDK